MRLVVGRLMATGTEKKRVESVAKRDTRHGVASHLGI